MHQYPYFSRKIILVIDFVEILKRNVPIKFLSFVQNHHFSMTSSQCIISYLQTLINPSPSCLDHSLLRWRGEALTVLAAWWLRHASQLSRDVTRTHEAASRGRGHWRVGGLPPVPSRDQLRLAGGSGGGLQHHPASPSHTGTPGHVSTQRYSRWLDYG